MIEDLSYIVALSEQEGTEKKLGMLEKLDQVKTDFISEEDSDPKVSTVVTVKCAH